MFYLDYWADKIGVAVFQDMPQKFNVLDVNASIAYFESDLHALVLGPRANHPSIISWDIFIEGGASLVLYHVVFVDYITSRNTKTLFRLRKIFSGPCRARILGREC